jgi:hypothetical protein
MTLSSTGIFESSPGFSYHSTEWALAVVSKAMCVKGEKLRHLSIRWDVSVV